ncbi:CRISPR-associated protein, Csd1 family [Thalassoporum mexicanum PCC 7367]|uniref:type I-C CRISPR-associated protein Cas8c/Csd1 n=1 Tax=Thalassoporum mexicanum TaxID=3457544 RepID=UPI00029FF687|nr:type I-C CRISPR-associated protein Cas8c/Csd1 [Pseudanabaena sp. PCC 7367]AFY70024.1 CRISPR-associated protein, Csd1 family [Pseudanabaena sp. PCC 7367]
MILSQLYEYSQRQMELPPAMYKGTKVRWVISLSTEGEFRDFIPRGGNSKADKRGTEMTAPHILRTVGVKPKLLADTGEYVLGIARPNSKPQRVKDCHQQFKDLVQQCANSTEEPTIRAIVKFLDTWNPETDRGKLPKDFDPADVITFEVGDTLPADEKAELHRIEEFWADYTLGDSDKSMPIMTCLITGERKPVVSTLPLLIKGLVGGQPSGTAMVSANAKPFTSYGLKSSLTSPISRDAAEGFAKALNHLIASPNFRLRIGSTTYVFWTRDQEDDFDALSYLDDPDPEKVKSLLSSPFTGQQSFSVDENQFYCLTLTANNARAVVRDWLETTVPEVKRNLCNWFEAQRIVAPDGEEFKSWGVYKLAASAYRDPAKEMLPAVPNALVKFALSGDRLPHDLLARVLRRNRAEQKVTYARVALIKLILTSQNKFARTEMETLNPNPDFPAIADHTAYHCGRLLAELEAIQRTALGKINATLTDRYYGAVSSTPASAFPPLLSGAKRAHLPKLRKNRPGAYQALEKRLEEIMSHLSELGFPKTLTLQQQGLFAIGYYHQKAANRAAAQTNQAS